LKPPDYKKFGVLKKSAEVSWPESLLYVCSKQAANKNTLIALQKVRAGCTQESERTEHPVAKAFF
jgi:hypothetical protein